MSTSLSAKETASTLVSNLDDNASWGDVKNTVMAEYKRETGDAKADSLAAVVLCLAFVVSAVLWVSSR